MIDMGKCSGTEILLFHIVRAKCKSMGLSEPNVKHKHYIQKQKDHIVVSDTCE